MEDGRPHNRVVDEMIVIGSGRSPASFTVVRIMEDRAADQDSILSRKVYH